MRSKLYYGYNYTNLVYILIDTEQGIWKKIALIEGMILKLVMLKYRPDWTIEILLEFCKLCELRVKYEW